MAEGLKPLTTKYTPSENSQTAIGIATTPTAPCCAVRPKITAPSPATSRVAPTKPSRGSHRGTRRDWYNSEPINRALTSRAWCQSRLVNALLIGSLLYQIGRAHV